MAENLGKSGKRLLEALENPCDGYEIGILVLEAARIADRLDQLNRIVTGDAEFWAHVTEARDGDLEIRIDYAMQEARQQAGTLRQLLAEIRRQRGGAEALDEGDVLADL